jgi:acylphosphatase
MTPKRFRLFARGKVQGVYFRQGLKETAEKNNVAGWVRNLPDYSVEAVLEGDESSIEAVIDWARLGPAGAFVEELKIIEENHNQEFSEFEIHY